MSDDNFKKLNQTLESIDKRLGGVEKQLNNPNTGLAAINQKIDHPETGLPGLNQKVDNMAAELSEVHKLAAGTYDLVRLEQEKRKEDTTQIRQFVGMPE